jgi:hypothetical protein
MLKSPKSIRRCALQTGISTTSTWRIVVEDLGLKPFHVQHIQALTRPQCVKRVECCEVMRQMDIMNTELRSQIIFSDEATFHISGRVNAHNTVFWGTENPRIVRTFTKNSPKENVWCECIKGDWSFFFLWQNQRHELSQHAVRVFCG